MNGKLQRGFTLIELMVSLTIGLLIMLVITNVYMSSFGAKKSQDDVVQVAESSRFAFDLISREVRKAGFRNIWEHQLPGAGSKYFCSTQALSATNAGAAMAGVNDPTQINPATLSTSGGTAVLNKSDVLQVNYYGENAGPGTGTSNVVDCHGYPVAANVLVSDVLFVAADTSNGGEPTLYCYTNNPTPATATHPGSVPLVAGVESMQFLYGEDTTGNGIITRYLPWSGSTVADHVLTVKASVVVRSPNNVSSDTSGVAKVFNHFDKTGLNYPVTAGSDNGAAFTAPVDRRVRQLVATEVATRNFCQ